jgi:hypothetical protein
MIEQCSAELSNDRGLRGDFKTWFLLRSRVFEAVAALGCVSSRQKPVLEEKKGLENSGLWERRIICPNRR